MTTEGRGMLDETTQTLEPDFFQYLLSLEVKKAVRYLYFFSLAIVQSDLPIKGKGTKTEKNLLGNLASLIRQEVRETDTIGNVSPGKFFIILHQADAHAIMGVGNRIRERIEQYDFKVNGDKNRLTVSLGAASFPLHANELDALIQRAGLALNKAKDSGGNKICLPGDEGTA